MEQNLFPRTTVGGVSVSRMIIGSNWLLGYSHRTPAADNQIRARFPDYESAWPMFKTFLDAGVDTIMGCMVQEPLLLPMINYAKEKSGKNIIIVDTPILNVDDTPMGRAEARALIKACKQGGATFCLPHHSCVEQLVNKNKHEITRLNDYTEMIREEGMIPGLSAHMPELILYSDENGYDVETYIQIYNCMGFLMQVEIETVNQIIRNAKKPVMTIKPMAAGRVTPFVGLNFSWSTIRDQDMITVGCTHADEAREDIEISLAALERRTANIGKRNSPNTNQDAFGKN